jgi:hypothetical protein
MSSSKSRPLRQKLAKWGLLALGLLPNWGRENESAAGPFPTIGGMRRSAANFMTSVELKAGSLAPKLDAEAADGSEAFHLDRYRGVKPVVLVFGSMSCNLFQAYVPNLEKVYQDYKDRAVFAFINIHEAGHEMEGYGYLLEADGDRGDRSQCVRKAMRQVQLTLPGFVDSSNDSALWDYGAFPARLVIVDADGYVARDFGLVQDQSWHWPSIRKTLDELCPHSRVALH